MRSETLTTEHIDALQAGRELDALVAVHVLGQKRPSVVAATDDAGFTYYEWPSQRYSTDIAAAWEVVEQFDYHEATWDKKGSLWYWYLEREKPTAVYGDANASTAPITICRAALKAVIA